MSKRPNVFEIKSGIMQALLIGDTIKTKGVVDHTGYSRNTIVKYLPKIREELLKAFNYYFKAKKESRL